MFPCLGYFVSAPIMTLILLWKNFDFQKNSSSTFNLEQ